MNRIKMKFSDNISRERGVAIFLMSLVALGIEYCLLFAFHRLAQGSSPDDQIILAFDNLFRLIMCFTITFGSICLLSGLIKFFRKLKIEILLLSSVLLSVAIHYFLYMK